MKIIKEKEIKIYIKLIVIKNIKKYTKKEKLNKYDYNFSNLIPVILS